MHLLHSRLHINHQTTLLHPTATATTDTYLQLVYCELIKRYPQCTDALHSTLVATVVKLPLLHFVLHNLPIIALFSYRSGNHNMPSLYQISTTTHGNNSFCYASVARALRSALISVRVKHHSKQNTQKKKLQSTVSPMEIGRMRGHNQWPFPSEQNNAHPWHSLLNRQQTTPITY
jgi:hypothetical protein